jgi:hypothetical protein
LRWRTAPARRASLVAANEKSDLEFDLWRLLRGKSAWRTPRAKADTEALELELLRRLT